MLTNGRVNGVLVTLCALVIGSPRKRPGDLIPPLSIFCDRFEESGIFLGSPTTYA